MRFVLRVIVSLVLAMAAISALFAQLDIPDVLRGLGQMVLIVLIAVVLVRWNARGAIDRTIHWMRQLRRGEATSVARLAVPAALAPIAHEVNLLAEHLTVARTAAEEEARLRRRSDERWTPEKLKETIRNKLNGRSFVVVSNGEPYAHLHRGRKIECIIPAGGLVTALDPVLRATDGLWIAHGSGDADKETVDDNGRLRVPPEDPHYTLKRVFLSPEQVSGYYEGFANEGLWPLCHVAHTRPTFRAADWAHYCDVNALFAKTVLEEIAETEDPLVLLQDYHFALLPRLIKEKRPDARVGLFWHIPWPNAEAFAICPWQKDILQGMLGADLVGFHTQYHVHHFLDTVDHALESRIEWERSTVSREGRETRVKSFPISVDIPTETPAATPNFAPALFVKEAGFQPAILAIGVDRLDYTKGILERFRAAERFLEKYPEYQGQFTLAQIGAPSRTRIPRYAAFGEEVDREVERINERFKIKSWRPIVFFKRHHNPDEVRSFYKKANVCLVTSLHDGMNLVAKEFVAARSDGDGVLILSRFAGASQELRDALIINPYDIEQTAEAIHTALTLDPADRRERMRRLRDTVRENNVYRWAGNLVMELAHMVPAKTPVAV
jgi:alpha,alpha-trehalose-phosphate synthase [UDP-forming]